jgi:hypothetical protein
MVRPRLSEGTHSAMALMLPGHPVDWARPLTNIATENKTTKPDSPKPTQAAADKSIPKPIKRRAPTRSPALPLRNWPTAYMARYTVSIPLRADLPNTSSIADRATGIPFRPR